MQSIVANGKLGERLPIGPNGLLVVSDNMIPSLERNALLAAVLANPDDDLPRLVFADWLDENGDPDEARFIRSQIALATLPEWDPQAVVLRRTRPEWEKNNTFRRGFGHAIAAPTLADLKQLMPSTLKVAPIERLGLFTATLAQWKTFVRSPWLPNIREIDFESIGAPIEAMRELCHAPGAAGIRALRFRSCTSPALPEVLNRLWRSLLGDRLQTLELAQAFGSDSSWFDDFMEAFHVGGEKLKSLRLQSMGFGDVNLNRFLVSRAWVHVEQLSIVDERGQASVTYLGYKDCWPALHTLRFDGVNVNFHNPHSLSTHLLPTKLTVLDLSNSKLHPEACQALAKAEHLAKLRIVRFRHMGCDNWSVRYLCHAKFWKNLVELDLSGNPIDENGAKHLLKRRPPEGLELLRLTPNFPDSVGEALQEHFRGRVVFETGPVDSSRRNDL